MRLRREYLGGVEHIDPATSDGYDHLATHVVQDHAAADDLIARLGADGCVVIRTDDPEQVERCTVDDPADRTNRGDAAVPLESCICGQCYFCPDGWHTDDEMPCPCTADCALTDSDARGGDER